MEKLEPIGRILCAQRYRYEAPRQGVLRPDNQAMIELSAGRGYEDGLTGLEGFERIWVIFELHLNESWHPFVQPPHEGAARRGVFATRSPHRPNRIGMSCVRLLGIDGLCLSVAGHDLLDQTPVLDLKPYVPYADAFPDAAAGWLQEVPANLYEMSFDADAATQAAWILQEGGLDCDNFAQVQLAEDPTDTERKRIKAGPTAGVWEIAYRTWRLDYMVNEAECSLRVTAIRSGYSAEDLVEGSVDRHKDKDVHRAYRERFS
jgi:tRNA-Thr(GGU) m(6)t(6)A37 methyltransferase TsaA